MLVLAALDPELPHLTLFYFLEFEHSKLWLHGCRPCWHRLNLHLGLRFFSVSHRGRLPLVGLIYTLDRPVILTTTSESMIAFLDLLRVAD